MHKKQKKNLIAQEEKQQGRANWKTWLVSAKSEGECFCLPEHILLQPHIIMGCVSYSVQGVRDASEKNNLCRIEMLDFFPFFSKKLNNK